ncbi:MAG TPA: response regulator transcription factor [Verrucomicrobiae bacterium]|nr:response regulator transcription factor [Verrucomicrobiae bacterium]
MPIKVSIVEDDARFRESMAILIDGAEGFRCAGAYPNADTALLEIPKAWPDVVLMDINLPRVSGIVCVSRLKAIRPGLRVIMLTAYMDTRQIFDSLKAGASGYLIKKTPAARILDAITEVHTGGAPMSPTIARKVVDHFQEARPLNQVEALSAREYEILSHVVKGLQYKEIAEALSISAHTVRAHIRTIYEKLHVSSRTEAVLKFVGKNPPDS